MQQPLLDLMGPIDGSPTGGGFPAWFKDTNGLRLAICLDAADPLCLAAPPPNPSAPLHFPDNFTDEAFWWSGDISLTTRNGGLARLTLALEAAFLNGAPAPGDQLVFARIRTRVDDLPAGHYTVTHPFGVDAYDVSAANANIRRSINDTRDQGNLGGGAFDPVLSARLGPFLIWDDPTGLPDGYLGDPNVPHRVVGSAFGTNFFQIEGPPNAFAGSPDACPLPDGSLRDDCIRGDLFAVQAKRAPNAGVELLAATYTNDASGQFVDVFADSDLGQQIDVRGASLADTPLDVSGGTYFVRVPYTGAPPSDLQLVNLSDTPPTVVPVGVLVDAVHVTGATFDPLAHRLVVTAVSSDAMAVLSASGFAPTSVQNASDGSFVFVAEPLLVPPRSVRVVSSAGGSDTDAVVLQGAAGG